MSVEPVHLEQHPDYHPTIYWLGMLTAGLTLLLITIGAIVTTIDAGMAFPDWPTSDGQGMLEYPWLKSTGDAFWEHGHRLAGMVVGFASIALLVAIWLLESRPLVKYLGIGVLAGVICQGILGGARVTLDERLIAMLHGSFAAWVFSLMSVLIMTNTRGWLALDKSIQGKSQAPLDNGAWFWGWATLITLEAQYLLGGLLRHLGNGFAWQVHPWFAIVVFVCTVGLMVGCWKHPEQWLKRWGTVVAIAVCLQILLGIVTWATRYGYPMFGIVAVQQSSPQMLLRSFHKVFGVITFMTAVIAIVRLWRIASLADGAVSSNSFGVAGASLSQPALTAGKGAV
jgi:heme a synthase